MAQLARTALELARESDFTKNGRVDFDAKWKAEHAALDQLGAEAEALPPGEVVGALIRFPRGDGYALYRVQKAKPLVLQHVRFGDCWQADPITIRGLRLADVQHMVDGDRRMRALFAKKGA